MRSVIALAIVAMASAGGAAAQTGTTPRDRPPAQASTGTASISGRVVDGQSGNAIARARVRLEWWGSDRPRPSVTTDGSGRFAFTRLPAGSFMIAVEKSTFMGTRYPAPRQTFRTSSRPVSIADGQTIDDIVVPMYHGGAIIGRILDADGDPVEGVTVYAVRVSKTGKPQPRGGGGSNDAGEFRVPRLDPGDYLLLATPQRYFDDPNSSNRSEQVPAATFYPSVLSITDAQPIAVARGATVAGMDLQLIEAPAAHLSGRLIDTTGQPITAGSSISVRPILGDSGVRTFNITGVGVKPDGTFQMTLPYGEYELIGETSDRRRRGAPPEPGTQRVGVIRLTVSGDIPDLAIELLRVANVSGRFVFDGTSPVPAVSSANGPGLGFSSDDGSCRSTQAAVAADWTFTADNVSGTCTIRVYANIPHWYVTAVRRNGEDVMQKPIAFVPGQHVRGLEIVMTDRPTELMFHVSDHRGEPTRDYVALVFPVDKSKWNDTDGQSVRPLVPPPDPPVSARSTTPGEAAGSRVFVGGTVPGSQVSAMSPNPSRREQMVGLPPGDYFAIALDDLETETFRDPEVLERLSRGATRVTLGDGAHADVHLRRMKQAQ